MLEVKNLTKIFDKNGVNEKIALKDFSIKLKNGEFVTVIGDNGAGKSTLMNCIAGVYKVDFGSILLDGNDVTGLPEYKRAKYIGRVFQDSMRGTAFDMTIEENLSIAENKREFCGLQWGITAKKRAEYADKLQVLDMGLEKVMTKKVRLLSGGQRQALTLFMAIMAKPKLLLLDEHTAALDPQAACKILKLTEKLAAQEEFCTIMITHNMKDALAYGNRTVLMRQGQLAMDVSGEERANMTVDELIAKFSIQSDRMLL
ncbi:MAG: ABC transporter ATP-binding protein [Eubacteriales bacterium]